MSNRDSDKQVRSVIVVDDSDLVRLKCKNVLSGYGYDVSEAANGEDALALLDHVSPDLILLDVVMPKIGGYDVLQRIKSTPALATIPIIMLTVQADKQDIIKGLNLGADDYITKPFQDEELIARVNAMLRIKRLYDELRMQNSVLEGINSDLKNANRKIEEQEKIALIGQFMIGIHHELRNPLAAALADAQIMLKFMKFEDDQHYFVSDIEHQLQKMKSILDDIKEMDSIDLEEYVDGIKMIKINKKKPVIEEGK